MVMRAGLYNYEGLINENVDNRDKIINVTGCTAEGMVRFATPGNGFDIGESEVPLERALLLIEHRIWIFISKD